MTSIKVATRRVYVVECPTCRKPVDFSGEGGIYFRSRKDAQEQANLWLGVDRIETTVTGICGCRNRKAERKSITVNAPPVCRKCFRCHRGICHKSSGER